MLGFIQDVFQEIKPRGYMTNQHLLPHALYWCLCNICGINFFPPVVESGEAYFQECHIFTTLEL